MASFNQLFLLIKEEEERDPPLLSSGEESKAMQAIRRGQDHSADDANNFWRQMIEKFRSIPGELLSELLGITAENIRRMPNFVEEALDKVEEQDKENGDGPTRSNVLPTGNEKNIPDMKMTKADAIGTQTYT